MFGSQSYESLVRFYHGDEARLKDVLVNLLDLKVKSSYRKSEKVLKKLCLVNFLENLKFSDSEIKESIISKTKLDKKLIVMIAKSKKLDEERKSIVKLIEEEKLDEPQIVDRTLAYKLDQEKARLFMLFVNDKADDSFDYLGVYLVVKNISKAYKIDMIDESFSSLFSSIYVKITSGLLYNSGRVAEDINLLSEKVASEYNNLPLSLYSLIVLEKLSDFYLTSNVDRKKLVLLREPLKAIFKYQINSDKDLFSKSVRNFFNSLASASSDNDLELIDNAFRVLKNELGVVIDLGDKNILYLLNFILEIVYNSSKSYEFYKRIINNYMDWLEYGEF